MWVGYNVVCTMGLFLGHSAWQKDRSSNVSMWNSYNFQPIGPWMGNSFTDLGAEGCCHSLNALLWPLLAKIELICQQPAMPLLNGVQGVASQPWGAREDGWGLMGWSGYGMGLNGQSLQAHDNITQFIITQYSSGPFYKHGSTLIPAWIYNHFHYKVWDDITYS